MKSFFDFEQYSPEYWAARRGIPTVSEFKHIIQPKKLLMSAGHQAYICNLIGQRFDPNYPGLDKATNDWMREGTRREPESRRWYEFDAGVKVRQVGFCTNDAGTLGCSPDGLIGDDGILELKNPSPEVHVGYCLADELPAEYVAQCYGALYVTGRQWLDFVSYCPGMPQQFRRRVFPEGAFFNALGPILDDFLGLLAEALQKFTREAA